LIGLMLTVGGGIVSADPLHDGVAAAERGDYTTALRLIRPLAEGGDALAQSQLGFMYYQGQGVTQDNREAVKWYRLSAEQGNAFGQYHLGLMYAEGKDILHAYMWLNLAASNLRGEEGQKAVTARDDVAKRLTAQQIERAQEMTRHCSARATYFESCE